MLVEMAVVLPLFALLALLPQVFSEYGLARLRAQEAARCLAWKGHAVKQPKAEAGRSLAPLRQARVESAATTLGATRAPGMSSEDPLVNGWVGRTLGTSKAEVRISVPPLPWGGPRLERSATHVVDIGRPTGGKGLDRWVRDRIGARAPPGVRTSR